MRIIVDAMGGDNAPNAVVEGTILAAERMPVQFVLVGRTADILNSLNALGLDNIPNGIEIANADDVITQDDEPSNAIRTKKGSSMVIALNMLKESGDAMLSAGNTGALLAGATLIVKRIKGIRRAALAPILNIGNGEQRIIIDCGANIDCTPEYLLQFGLMGSAYAKGVLGKENPKIGLLNIGAEETKGMPLQKESFELLSTAKNEGKINFVGNVEARDIFSDIADVVVCDGFSGNIMLKSIEGTGLFIVKNLKSIIYRNWLTKLAGGILKRGISDLKKTMDYTEIGGSVLLGISKPVIKAHGSSNAKAICNALLQAVKAAESGFVNLVVSS